jgi:Na+-driven multidrug efflux pump
MSCIPAIAVLLFEFICLPIAYVASEGLTPVDIRFLGTRTPTGIWFVFAVSGIVAATVATGWFEFGTWRGTDLNDAPDDADRSVEGATQGEGVDETESGTATSEA